jgi:multicomponent Na+:H+ antiporter subunit F
MNEFFLAAASVVLLTVAGGLARVVRGPRDADRVAAVQLLGTGAVAIFLLLGATGDLPAATDLALVTALLAAVVPVLFVAAADNDRQRQGEGS